MTRLLTQEQLSDAALDLLTSSDLRRWRRMADKHAVNIQELANTQHRTVCDRALELVENMRKTSERTDDEYELSVIIAALITAERATPFSWTRSFAVRHVLNKIAAQKGLPSPWVAPLARMKR
jgi:hypothetical protein